MLIKFDYPNGVPTVEQAMKQVVMAWSGSPDTNPLVRDLLIRQIEETAAAGLREIRDILTAEMATLFDPEGTAVDWNEAIEKCIQLVEGTLP